MQTYSHMSICEAWREFRRQNPGVEMSNPIAIHRAGTISYSFKFRRSPKLEFQFLTWDVFGKKS